MGVAAGAKRHFVIVGIGEDAWNVAQLIESIGNRSSEIVAFFRDQPEHTAGRSAVEAACPGARVLELSMFQQMLKDHIVDEVIFAVDRQSMQTLEDLFLLCEEEGVKFRVMVNFFPAMASEVTLDRLYDLPLLTFSTTPDNDYLLFLKRIIDVIGAIGILLFFSPLLLPIVLAIKLTSKGPLLFMQQRCGLNGRLFRLYKFRSMYEDAAARRAEMEGLNEMDGPVFKCANDPRITTVGRFLRKYSLDEIPQLLNVVNGDMSLVGPRPPLPEEVKQYEQWHRRRLRMRPGLTCLWVLEGRNKLDFFSWMRLDLEYIDHWSLVLDCKILLLSIPHVLSGKGM